MLLDEPLAGMSPRERVETVALLRSIGRGRTMIILIEGTPDEIKGNSKVQEAYLGGVHDVLAAE